MKAFEHGWKECPGCGGACDARARRCAGCRWEQPPDGYMSMEEAAALWCVSVSAVKMRIYRGIVQTETIGRRRVIPRQAA
jgi:hypothetical protein